MAPAPPTSGGGAAVGSRCVSAPAVIAFPEIAYRLGRSSGHWSRGLSSPRSLSKALSRTAGESLHMGTPKVPVEGERSLLFRVLGDGELRDGFPDKGPALVTRAVVAFSGSVTLTRS